MINRFFPILFILLATIFIPLPAMANSLADADAIYEQGGMVNLINAIGMYEAYLEKKPDSFEANWKCARACREYGEAAKKGQVDDWKKICAEYGKKGMIYGAKARDINPDHPAGYYYFGLSVGIYSDGTSILTALKEGLKDKTQINFEKVYELDKWYDDAGSILALGRFWAVLPWPMNNKKKSLAYYREYQQTPFFQGGDECKVYLAELLISMGGQANKAEAKQILEQAIKAEDPYFNSWARRLMENIK
jgi:hypothetical protein